MVCKLCGKLSVGNERCLFCGAKHDKIPHINADESVRGRARVKFCPYCGAKIQDGEKFCSNCGASAFLYGGQDGGYGKSGGLYYDYAAAKEKEAAEKKALLIKKKAASNKRLGVFALIFGCLLLAGGTVGLVLMLMQLDVNLFLFEPEDALQIACMVGAYTFVPALVMSIVSLVREKRYKYKNSIKPNMAAFVITIVGAVIVITCIGIYVFHFYYEIV